MILVTGGRGFIGAHTGCALAELGYESLPASRRTDPVLDCTDLDSVLAIGRRQKITGIVHLAAAGLGPGPVLEQLWDNTVSLFNLVRAARAWGVQRMVYASTIGVYGGIDADVYREDASLPIDSLHPIPVSKKSGEILLSAIDDVDIRVARIGAIWGPGGRESSPFFGAPQLVHAAVRHTDPGPVHAGQAIDMLYARDCGHALALLQTASGLKHRTYNVGSGHLTTMAEVAQALTRQVPDFRPSLLQGGQVFARLDISRLREDTGFEPAWPLDRAVADYLSWIR